MLWSSATEVGLDFPYCYNIYADILCKCGYTFDQNPRFRKAFLAPSSSLLQLIQTNHIQRLDKNSILAGIGLGGVE